MRDVVCLALTGWLVSGCYFSMEAGVSKPMSGDYKKQSGKSVGISLGFAYDMDLAFLAVGGGTTIHVLEKNSGEVEKILSAGTRLRADLTLHRAYGYRLDRLLRATGTVRFGGCRILRDRSENKCRDDSEGNNLMVSMGALYGVRSVIGDTMTFSASPFYMRSSHPVDPDASVGGVMFRVTFSSSARTVLGSLAGLGSLGASYDREASRRRQRRAALKNKLRGGAKKCKKGRNGRKNCI